MGWVKAHIGILGSEAADVLAKNAAEGVPLDDHEKWMSGGGIRQWAKRRKRENVEEGGGIKRAADGSNKLLPTARRKGHRKVVGKEDWTSRGGWMPKMWGGRADYRLWIT